MTHIIWVKVTKFQQPLLFTLGVADEKPEGGGGKKKKHLWKPLRVWAIMQYEQWMNFEL